MRIRFTLDITRDRPAPIAPEGDVYSTTDRAAYTEGPQAGFSREDPYARRSRA